KLDNIKMAMSFINTIKNETLDNSQTNKDPKAIQCLLHSPEAPCKLKGPEEYFTIKLFLVTTNAPEDIYNKVWDTYNHRHPHNEDQVPSYYHIKLCIAELTGIKSIIHNMCPNSCITYTGPFANFDKCRKCSTSCDNQQILKKGKRLVSTQQFHTMPIGHQIQALWRDKKNAENMRHHEKATTKIVKKNPMQWWQFSQ
ncbi:hypothetical protein SERLA73DRAFT_44151, partial [Serpula lacrymans var. lacrymans S7.3]